MADVIIEIDFEESLYNAVNEMAKKNDITFNEQVIIILKEYMDKIECQKNK